DTKNVGGVHLLVEEFDHTHQFGWQLVSDEKHPDPPGNEVGLDGLPVLLGIQPGPQPPGSLVVARRRFRNDQPGSACLACPSASVGGLACCAGTVPGSAGGCGGLVGGGTARPGGVCLVPPFG